MTSVSQVKVHISPAEGDRSQEDCTREEGERGREESSTSFTFFSADAKEKVPSHFDWTTDSRRRSAAKKTASQKKTHANKRTEKQKKARESGNGVQFVPFQEGEDEDWWLELSHEHRFDSISASKK